MEKFTKIAVENYSAALMDFLDILKLERIIDDVLNDDPNLEGEYREMLDDCMVECSELMEIAKSQVKKCKADIEVAKDLDGIK